MSKTKPNLIMASEEKQVWTLEKAVNGGRQKVLVEQSTGVIRGLSSAPLSQSELQQVEKFQGIFAKGALGDEAEGWHGKMTTPSGRNQVFTSPGKTVYKSKAEAKEALLRLNRADSDAGGETLADDDPSAYTLVDSETGEDTQPYPTKDM